MHKHLLNLLISNKGKGYFKADTSNPAEATIYLYDVIVSEDWWGGITPLAFMKELAAITAPTIHLRINSPGGDVFAARAMQTAMREHSSKIIAHIDGLCASAATFLLCDADESVISQGGMFMIHNAWTIAMGNAQDFNSMAVLLAKIDTSICKDYVAKTGQAEQQIIAWMDTETYFIGQEAVDAGFVDAIAAVAPKAQINWDLSAYGHPPAQNLAEQPIIKPEPLDNRAKPLENHAKNRPTYREMLA
jgi:ATP-dependent Clp protease protease subunit